MAAQMMPNNNEKTISHANSHGNVCGKRTNSIGFWRPAVLATRPNDIYLIDFMRKRIEKQ